MACGPQTPWLITLFSQKGLADLHRLSEFNFLFILKVANILCFILIKCSEQKARFMIL